jgi:hypothetical protein
MAKGDTAIAGQEADYQKKRYEGQINPIISSATNAYKSAIPQAQQDYGNIMGRYQNFADTGGFSPEELAGIRARSMSPIRAAYSQAEQGVSRQRALQGGYSPNATATMAKMAREQGQLGSDTAQNTETNIAELIRQAKLGGLSGMASLYGTTPGMASMFGNQVLNATGQSGDFGNNMVKNRIGISQMPSDFDIAMGRLGSIGKMFGGVAGGLFTGGGADTSGWTNNEAIYA